MQTPYGSAFYPTALANFPLLTDRPGPDSTTIDFAAFTMQVYAEVYALEATLGPVLIDVPYQSLSAAINGLYFGKSPVGHVHEHLDMENRTDDHSHDQYMPIDGSVAYGHPIEGEAGGLVNNFVTLAQLQGGGATTVSSLQDTMDALAGSNHPVTSIPGPVHITGGHFKNITNPSGQFILDFGGTFSENYYLLYYTRIPVPVQPTVTYILDANQDFSPLSATLLAPGLPLIQQIALQIFLCQSPSVSVTGYTDSSQTLSFSQALSQQQASAVQNQLLQDLGSYPGGANFTNWVVSGQGQADPEFPNNDLVGMLRNNRVVIEFLDTRANPIPQTTIDLQPLFINAAGALIQLNNDGVPMPNQYLEFSWIALGL